MDLEAKRAGARNARNSARGLRERSEMSLAEARELDARAEVIEAEIAADELAIAQATVAAAGAVKPKR